MPGDDVRAIDWNVTARTGEPFVKRFVEERELTVMLLVDVSASQDFGSGRRSKLEAAVELSRAARDVAPSRTATRSACSCSTAAPTSTSRRARAASTRCAWCARCWRAARPSPCGRRALGRAVVPARAAARRCGAWFAQAAAADARTSRGARPASPAALEFCRQVLPRRAVLFLISDFLDEGYMQVLRHANRKHDVVAALITDPREARDAAGRARSRSRTPRAGGRGSSTRGRGRSARSWRRGRRATRRSSGDQLRATGMDLVVFDASGSMVDPLLRFFRERERRLRR